jgi:hypothetical protein
MLDFISEETTDIDSRLTYQPMSNEQSDDADYLHQLAEAIRQRHRDSNEAASVDRDPDAPIWRVRVSVSNQCVLIFQ